MRYKTLIKQHNTAFLCPLDAPLLHAIIAVIARIRAQFLCSNPPVAAALSSTCTMAERASPPMWPNMGHLGLIGPSGCPRSDDLHPTRGLVRVKWAVWRAAGPSGAGLGLDGRGAANQPIRSGKWGGTDSCCW